MHKDCGQRHSHLEAFRIAKLLSAGRLVLSERAHPRDEHEHAEVVTFFDNANHLRALYSGLVRADAWRGVAERAAARFRERFEPHAIFRRAGVYSWLCGAEVCATR